MHQKNAHHNIWIIDFHIWIIIYDLKNVEQQLQYENLKFKNFE